MATLTRVRRDHGRATRSRGYPIARDASGGPVATALFAVAALVAVLVVLFTQYAGVLRVPFINDDYVFLDRVRGTPWYALLGFDRLTFGWYRPWSRELHYAWLSGAFGEREAPFHAASLALWVGVLIAYGTLVVRTAGTRAAAIATAGVTALSAWAVPVLWVAGVQELWMLWWSLLALHAHARGRGGWAAAAFALALLSKETAAVLPGVMVARAALVERGPLDAAVRRVVPCALVLAAWLCVHPQAGGRLWQGDGSAATPAEAPSSATRSTATPSAPLPSTTSPSTPTPSTTTRSAPTPASAATADAGARLSPGERVASTALSLVNLDRVPRPTSGWAGAAMVALPAVLALGALVALSSWRPGSGRGEARAGQRAAVLGGVWALLGWLPLAWPGLGWHNYYGLLGALGAWLTLGVVLARVPWLAVIVVAGSLVLRAAAADTPSRDWGTEWYQRRAGDFLDYMKQDLKRQHPTLPPRSRLFFLSVPSNVGFLTDGGPSLRVWYRDTTLWAGYFSQYDKRPPGRPGRDYFFRYDSTAGWREILAGPENAAVARRANPAWERDARELAAAFARVGDWQAAARQYEKLARAGPVMLPEPAIDAGVARAMAGDTTAALEWFNVAARSASTPEQLLQARDYIRELRGMDGGRRGR